MVFRTVGAIATALIGVSGQALAQYYPPHQAYPRQPLPPAVNADGGAGPASTGRNSAI